MVAGSEIPIDSARQKGRRRLRADQLVRCSWRPLTGAQRVLLGRLSVFAGGFDLAAVEAV
jgi:predicted ATPase